MPASDSKGSVATGSDGLSFPELREAAMRQVRRLAPDTWTDHNAHDPGITILEQLCYTLTDLAYRIDYSVRDLLAGAVGADGGGTLFTPARILSCNPVTLIDLRKLVIDVDGVKNAWIEAVDRPEPALYYDPSDETLYFERMSHRKPVLVQGVYRVLIATDGSVPDIDVSREVSVRLHAHRNLGQDFESPVILATQGIVVGAEIEVGEVDDPELILAQIYDVIATHISPRIGFRTLSELSESGKTLDEAFTGPTLAHGFLDEEELAAFGRVEGLRSSDLIQVIMGVPGVRAVHDIWLSDGVTEEDWYLSLDRNRTPVLDSGRSLARKTIRLRRGRLMWDPDVEETSRRFAELQSRRRPRPVADGERDRKLVEGTRRAVERYHSFQHLLPKVFGVGASGLEPGASPERQARVRQLRAYLMFFDQVLANCFSQAAWAPGLFSVADGDQALTYRAQLAQGIPHADEVFRDPGLEGLQKMTESPGIAASRRDRALNHLLARYSEEFGDFSRLRNIETRIAAKTAFLRDYPEISVARARAHDLTRPSWDTGNISGFERRLARRLGVQDVRRKTLSVLGPGDDGGFHLVEHVLLRPMKEDADQWQAGEDRQWRTEAFLAGVNSADPYSSWITLVFPDWIRRLSEREFVEKVARDEAPAHLRIRVLWLNPDSMRVFEDGFRDWLDSMVATA